MAGVNIATIGAMFTPVHFERLLAHYALNAFKTALGSFATTFSKTRAGP